ncbi:MAG: hypothetical protein WC356_01880 [Candidatus Micrarchaeia archaeon]|jgi:hypothetical protein
MSEYYTSNPADECDCDTISKEEIDLLYRFICPLDNSDSAAFNQVYTIAESNTARILGRFGFLILKPYRRAEYTGKNLWELNNY